MKGRPNVYRVDAALILRGLLDEGSDARTMLDLASCNRIEAHASAKDWNLVMWAIQTTLRDGGGETIDGGDLMRLKSALPVSFD